MGPTPRCVPDPHALADPVFGDLLAHCIDDTHAVAVRNDPWKGQHGAANAGARLDVRGIDARPLDAHAHLAGRGVRVGQLGELQDFGRRSGAIVVCG
jgi:hypothetical protein